MPKTATVYKDLGKLANDLLTKDFGVGKNVVEVKSKTPSGITFTPKATKDEKAVSATLEAAYSPMPGTTTKATFDTGGGVSMSLEAVDAVMKGLTLTGESTYPGKTGLFGKANLICDYKSEMYTLKASYDYFKGDLLASCSTMMNAMAMGLDCVYSPKSGGLSSYAAACQFVQPDFTAFASCSSGAKGKKLSCSYYHSVSSAMQLGVLISTPLAKIEPSLKFGTAYKLDKDTTVKAMVDEKAILSTSFKQKISPITTMTLAATVDTVNLSDNNHKFGMQLNITP